MWICRWRMVDRIAGGQLPAPTDYTLTWEANHSSAKGAEGPDPYVPFTVVVDKALAGKEVAHQPCAWSRRALP